MRKQNRILLFNFYKIVIILCFGLLSTFVSAQHYFSSSIFAHNDYEQVIPFHTAYHHQVGYIEADIFLQRDQLFVAHTRPEIKQEKTLERLYLKPLQNKVSENNGFVYPDKEKSLVLMIDLKTDGLATLTALVKMLKKYPSLLACPTLEVAVSGNVPDPSQWNEFPDFIHFDGRPGIAYSDDQLKRVTLISANFKDYSKWNGKGVLTESDREKIVSTVNAVHAKGKKIRFWATPDFGNAWIQLMKLNVDILNTDNVSELAEFVGKIPKNTFHNDQPYEVYCPQFKAKERSPKNVILMIGDGMGLQQLYSSYTANYGKLNIFNMKDIGFSITPAIDSYNTDSAAGATAIATGKKTNNRHIGVDSAGTPLPLITEVLKKKGFKTAIITSGDITDATPASFYAHRSERSLSNLIAQDLFLADNDILIGSGMEHFRSVNEKKDLLDDFRKRGCFVSESIDSIENTDTNKWLILDKNASISIANGRGNFLLKSFQFSLKSLSASPKPFFMMLEGAQIDWGGHSNDMEYVVLETHDFDRVVGEAMKFIDENGETLLIVTADHETGGLSLFDGDESKGFVHGHFSTEDHTGAPVPVFAYGPGSEIFRGVYPNSDIYRKIMEAIKIFTQKEQ